MGEEMNAYMRENRVGKVVDVNAISRSDKKKDIWGEMKDDVMLCDMEIQATWNSRTCISTNKQAIGDAIRQVTNQAVKQASNMGYYITWNEHYLIVKFPNSYRPYKNSWMISWFPNTEN